MTTRLHERRLLGEIAAFTMGQAPPSNETNGEGRGVPFYRSGEFAARRPVLRMWTTKPLRFAQCTDVLVCVVGANAGQANLGANGAIGRSVAAITPSPAVDQYYLYHFLQSIRRDLNLGSQGSAQGVITKKDLASVSVPVPPLSEQRRIVELIEEHLSHLDAADASLTLASRRAERLSDSAVAAALASVDAAAEPLSQLLDCPLSNGKSVPTQPGGFPVLRLTALREGRVDLSERKEGAWTADEAHRWLVKRGDFLVSRGNGSLHLVGRGGLVVDEPDAVAFPDTLIRVRPDTEKILPEFLARVWNSRAVRAQVERSVRTTAGIYKINQQAMGGITLPVPDLETQRRIVTTLADQHSATARLLDSVDAGRSRGTALRRAVLALAFSGRLTGASSDTDLIEELSAIDEGADRAQQ